MLDFKYHQVESNCGRCFCSFEFICLLLRLVYKVGLIVIGSWKCLHVQRLDGSLRYHPLISLSKELLLSLIAKFMTSSRGHPWGYEFSIPKSEEVERMRWGW